MAEVVGLKVQVDGSEAVQSVGSLKKQLREAQTEVATLSDKFGATSKQAVEAAKRAADLRDRIGDAKALTDAFNPDRKFQAFASSLQGVVGGFTAVQGALGLVGVESEEVEKTLLKVNSAMALSQGLNSLLEARDSFKNLSTVIQSTTIFQKANNAATTIAIALQKAFGVATVQTAAGFRILKTAIAATGIGLLVVGITALISKIQDWTSASDRAAEAQKKLAKDTDFLNAQINNEIAILTSVGGKEDEIYRKRVQIANNELNVLRAAAKQKGELTQEEIKKFGELKTQLVTLEIDEKNRIKKVNEDARKEKEKKDKEASDKAKAALKDRQEKELKLIEDRFNFEKEINDELKKLVEDRINFIEGREKQFAENRERVNQLTENRIKGIVTTSISERTNIANELLLSQQDKEISALTVQYNKRLELVKGNAFLENKLTEEYEAQKSAIKKKYADESLAATANILGQAAVLFGKQTAAGKTVAVAEATINTYLAASKALTGIVKGNPLSAGLAIAQAAIIVATGLKNVREIVKTKVPGSSAGGSVPSSASLSAPLTPNAPIQNTITQLDQATINSLGSASNRAYVVESDITNSQERITRINRAARLG